MGLAAPETPDDAILIPKTQNMITAACSFLAPSDQVHCEKFIQIALL